MEELLIWAPCNPPTADMQPCGSSVVHGYTTAQHMGEEIFRLQGEMRMAYEEEVFLFGGRSDGARTLFIENKERLRTSALFHN